MIICRETSATEKTKKNPTNLLLRVESFSKDLAQKKSHFFTVLIFEKLTILSLSNFDMLHKRLRCTLTLQQLSDATELSVMMTTTTTTTTFHYSSHC
jgi:hypothetical protein